MLYTLPLLLDRLAGTGSGRRTDFLAAAGALPPPAGIKCVPPARRSPCSGWGIVIAWALTRGSLKSGRSGASSSVGAWWSPARTSGSSAGTAPQDTEAVADRLGQSANEAIPGIILPVPMGAGMGSSVGTSLPYSWPTRRNETGSGWRMSTVGSWITGLARAGWLAGVRRLAVRPPALGPAAGPLAARGRLHVLAHTGHLDDRSHRDGNAVLDPRNGAPAHPDGGAGRRPRTGNGPRGAHPLPGSGAPRVRRPGRVPTRTRWVLAARGFHPLGGIDRPNAYTGAPGMTTRARCLLSVARLGGRHSQGVLPIDSLTLTTRMTAFFGTGVLALRSPRRWSFRPGWDCCSPSAQPRAAPGAALRTNLAGAPAEVRR